MRLAPIVLFVYNRPQHTRQAVDSLRINALVKESELFIFSDGPKNENSRNSVEEVRKYIRTITGFKEINIIERQKNLGLSSSVILGITDIIDKYGKIIVLEDDLLVSPFFLKFMNEGLYLYENEEKVASICGYMYPVEIEKETIFFRIPDCWGWATWKRSWSLFESDSGELINELKSRKLISSFDLNSTFSFSGMLKKESEGKLDSWAIRWYASMFLSGKLSLYPGKSLVRNIGFDRSGIHCSSFDHYKSIITDSVVRIVPLPVQEDTGAFKKIQRFFIVMRRKRIINKVLGLLPK